MNKLPIDFELTRYGLHVRLVREDDAEFIVKLRTDKRLGRYIHATGNDVEKQREWIRNYKDRESAGSEYYFMYETAAGNPLGVYRLYCISDQSFISGSWVFLPDAPMGASMVAFIIAREIAWNIVPQAVNLYDIKKENTSVLQFTKTFEPHIIRETEDTLFFENTKEDFESHKDEVIRVIANRMARLCELYDKSVTK